jgi:hypothetical protein
MQKGQIYRKGQSWILDYAVKELRRRTDVGEAIEEACSCLR